MEAVKAINSGDIKAGMSLVERDGALLEVVKVVHRAEWVEVSWKSMMFHGTKKLSPVKRYSVLIPVME